MSPLKEELEALKIRFDRLKTSAKKLEVQGFTGPETRKWYEEHIEIVLNKICSLESIIASV